MSARVKPRPDARAIEDWLVRYVSGVAGLAPDVIDVRDNYASFGLSSQDMVVLSGDLEAWLGRELSPTLAWEYPTIETLARQLAADGPPNGDRASA